MQEKYKEALDSFARLLEIMDTLREKCPWDRKQTNLSLKPNTIEEVYELAQAIEDNDTEDIKKRTWRFALTYRLLRKDRSRREEIRY